MGTLKLENGQTLDVDEEDVHLCFGIPRGPETLQRTLPRDNNDVTKEWRTHLNFQIIFDDLTPDE